MAGSVSGRWQGELMTVGELSRRTGLSSKAIREYEALGLIYATVIAEARSRGAFAVGRPSPETFRGATLT